MSRRTGKSCLVILGGLLLLLVVAGMGMRTMFKKALKDGGFVESWHDADGTVLRDLSYGNGSRNTYDLFIPSAVARTDSVPLMLFVHGGSWMGGDKKEEHYACRRYAKMGIVTVSMNYTLLGQKDAPEASIPVMLDEIGRCVADVVRVTEERGIHLGQMAIGGTSAGGHLALLYAMRCGSTSPLPVRFVVEKVGPTDMHFLFTTDSLQFVQTLSDGDEKKLTETMDFLRVLAGRSIIHDSLTWERADSVVRSASPVSWADSSRVPVLGAYGGADSLVKPWHAELLKQAMERSGTPCHIILFPNSWHNLSGDVTQRDSLQRTTKEWAARYFHIELP